MKLFLNLPTVSKNSFNLPKVMENYFDTKLDYIRVGHWEASSTSLKMNSKENGVGIKWIYVYLKSMRWISSKLYKWIFLRFRIWIWKRIYLSKPKPENAMRFAIQSENKILLSTITERTKSKLERFNPSPVWSMSKFIFLFCHFIQTFWSWGLGIN